MACPEIVKKFRAEIGNGLRIENEEVRFRVDDNTVGLGERRRDIRLGRRSGFLKGGMNFFRQLQVGFKDEHTPARSGFIGGMARRRFVHEFKKGRGAARVLPRATP